MYWKITPYHNNDADFCIMPGNNNGEHREVLKYAYNRLEGIWDQAVAGNPAVSVTLELLSGPCPELDIE